MHARINYLKGSDTHSLIFFPCRFYSSCLELRWWTMDTYGVVEEANNTDHHGWSYIISDKNWQTDYAQHETYTCRSRFKKGLDI